MSMSIFEKKNDIISVNVNVENIFLLDLITNVRFFDSVTSKSRDDYYFEEIDWENTYMTRVISYEANDVHN